MKRKHYRIDGGCVMCLTCRSVCPAGAITADRRGVHIDDDRCVRCGACLANCPTQAIAVVEDPAPAGEEGHEHD
ncbi:MAG: 4Fe-4S binding protein [Planctomycetota bacterium]